MIADLRAVHRENYSVYGGVEKMHAAMIRRGGWTWAENRRDD